MKKIYLFLLLLSLSVPLICQSKKVSIIYDTDMALDVDDAGALAILHHLADLNECEILAVGISSTVTNYDGYHAAACASAINGYYGRPEIPIGGYRGPYLISHTKSKYVEEVARNFPHKIWSGLETEEAWRLYRKILSSSPDSSVVIVVVGFLNNLEMLLDSKPDDISPLNGYDLVAQKVKLVSCMGGRFPDGAEEFNFNTYARSTLFVLSSWPTSMVFGGSELGSMVKCGKVLNEVYSKEDNPVAMAWHFYCNGGQRESWDELSVLYAVRGCDKYFRLSEPGQTFFTMRGGNWKPKVVNSRNIWIPDKNGKHNYLLPAMSYESLGKELDKMLIVKPLKK